ncbi:class II fumarate hydratase [Prochlorococcus marinus]|uniref:class II fumarate hydratase n=1 Tax=Prochlorococcus marinus TaxID=1219 RepID=UPI0022B3318B|nr:class II fumarate hydratase [Prochlorococcus marinus]
MSNMKRLEKDSLGSIDVPKEALWGAQTQRSILNFAIGDEVMPLEIIYAIAQIKASAARVNNHLGLINTEITKLITEASSEIIEGKHNDQFPLKVWQTGSGTQTNMNVNEVISNIASKRFNNPLGSHNPLHPNDHVNCSQSTNDVFPAAIQIATIKSLKGSLIPELKKLINLFQKKSKEWKDIIKIGRTHLQDAVPLTLGQEASAWESQLEAALRRIEINIEELYPLPLGGTAIGTGLNAPENFDNLIALDIAKTTNLPFATASNKFAIMASHDSLVNVMSQLKLLAITLLKIVNDLRLLSCGPRAGLSELQLPSNEPGSSIMPGKINPTQCEAMAMICTQIIGMDTSVSIAGSGGHLQMNVYKPLIGYNILKSINLIQNSCKSCRKNMIEGIQPNKAKIKQYLDNSLMLVTALAPSIGYEKASKIAQLAHEKNLSLRQASNQLNYIDEKEFDRLVDPKSMI